MTFPALFLTEFKSSTGLTLRRWQTVLSGKPVLHFVHGNGFNGRVYLPMLSKLSGSYDLVLTDIQGHGESDIGRQFPGWDETADMLTEALQAFCRDNKVATVLGVGHSFGGVMTSLMAARHPERFQQLILLDPVFLPPLYARSIRIFKPLGVMSHLPMVSRARKRQQYWPDRASALRYFKGRGMFRLWKDESVEAFVEFGLKDDAEGVALKAPAWLEAEIFASYSQKIWPAIRKLRVPTDIVYGASTYPFIKQGLNKAKSQNPLLSLHKVPGDHCFMMTYPQSTAKLIKNLRETAK